MSLFFSQPVYDYELHDSYVVLKYPCDVTKTYLKRSAITAIHDGRYISWIASINFNF